MHTNILDTIKIIKKNKKKFISGDGDDYFKILTNLYNEIYDRNICISELIDDFSNNKFDKFEASDKDILFSQINNEQNFGKMFSIKNFNQLVEFIPLFELLLIENKRMVLDEKKIYHVHTEINLCKYNTKDVTEIIKVLLHMCQQTINYRNKVIISLIIFDYVFLNFQFVIDHVNFANGLKNKLKEFAYHNNKFNEICENYKLEKDIIDKWINAINVYFQD